MRTIKYGKRNVQTPVYLVDVPEDEWRAIIRKLPDDLFLDIDKNIFRMIESLGFRRTVPIIFLGNPVNDIEAGQAVSVMVGVEPEDKEEIERQRKEMAQAMQVVNLVETEFSLVSQIIRSIGMLADPASTGFTAASIFNDLAEMERMLDEAPDELKENVKALVSQDGLDAHCGCGDENCPVEMLIELEQIRQGLKQAEDASDPAVELLALLARIKEEVKTQGLDAHCECGDADCFIEGFYTLEKQRQGLIPAEKTDESASESAG